MIQFGKAMRGCYGMQTQYACRYLIETEGYSYLGEGIKFEGDKDDYHGIMIDEDDAIIFNERLTTHKQTQGF